MSLLTELQEIEKRNDQIDNFKKQIEPWADSRIVISPYSDEEIRQAMDERIQVYDHNSILQNKLKHGKSIEESARELKKAYGLRDWIPMPRSKEVDKMAEEMDELTGFAKIRYQTIHPLLPFNPISTAGLISAGIYATLHMLNLGYEGTINESIAIKTSLGVGVGLGSLWSISAILKPGIKREAQALDEIIDKVRK